MAKINKVLIGAVVLGIVFVITFVGALYWIKSKDSNSEAAKKQVKKHKTTVHAIEEPIVANLSDDPSINIRVAVTLQAIEDKVFGTELEEDDSLATNVIITVLRHKKVSEVSAATAPDAPMKIREEIVKELNKAYETDKFVDVNFREFITQ